MDKNRFVFLGTGGSLGVPIIGCECAVCSSTDPCNKRLRPSGVLFVENKTIVIDAGPDFRQQFLRFGLTSLDALLLTHTHYDHIGGLDDLRIFYLLKRHRPICVVSEETYRELKFRYHYLFKRSASGDEEHAVHIDFKLLKGDFGVFDLFGIPLHYISYSQAGMKVNGFRVGSFAYVSDIRDYSDEIFTHLKGVKTLVVSALRAVPTEVHFSLDEAASFAKKVGAKQTFITHITHDLEHRATNASLPKEVQLAYDGLEITF